MSILNREVQKATRKKLEEGMGNPARLILFTQEPSRLVLSDQIKGQEGLFKAAGEGRE